MANRKACESFDITDNNTVGKRIRDIIQHQELLETIDQKSESSPSRVEISLDDGRVLNAQLTPIPEIGLVVNMQDITQYVELRGHASLVGDPDRSFFREQFMRGMGGIEPPADLDPPDAERVIITIHPQQVSSPSLYGGRLSNEARKELK